MSIYKLNHLSILIFFTFDRTAIARTENHRATDHPDRVHRSRALRRGVQGAMARGVRRRQSVFCAGGEIVVPGGGDLSDGDVET